MVAPGTLTPTVTTIVPTGNVTTVVPTGNVTTVPTGNVTPTVPTVAPTGVPVGNPKAILKPGDTVFIGEYGLDLSATGVADGTTLGWFQAGADVATSSPDDTLIVTNAKSFNVVPGTRAGAWYNMNNNRAVAINVKDPSLNIRVWDVQVQQGCHGQDRHGRPSALVPH